MVRGHSVLQGESESRALECGFGCVAFEVMMKCSPWKQAPMEG